MPCFLIASGPFAWEWRGQDLGASPAGRHLVEEVAAHRLRSVVARAAHAPGLAVSRTPADGAFGNGLVTESTGLTLSIRSAEEGHGPLGVQTVRRGDARPVRGLLGGKDPTDCFSM